MNTQQQIHELTMTQAWIYFQRQLYSHIATSIMNQVHPQVRDSCLRRIDDQMRMQVWSRLCNTNLPHE